MITLAIIAAVYLAIGLFTIWYVSNMPWELDLRDHALIGLMWPLFWFQEFRR